MAPSLRSDGNSSAASAPHSLTGFVRARGDGGCREMLCTAGGSSACNDGGGDSRARERASCGRKKARRGGRAKRGATNLFTHARNRRAHKAQSGLDVIDQAPLPLALVQVPAPPVAVKPPAKVALPASDSSPPLTVPLSA